jgi:AcrR family transcriptional regulator
MKESRKVLYTKKTLKESLLVLLHEKDISKITVKELCQVADVNRSTFYSHYKDVFDIIEQMEDHIMGVVMKNINEQGITSAYQLDVFEAIFNELKMNNEELELLYLNPGSMKCFDRLFEGVYDYASPLLSNRFGELSDQQIKHIYGFISRGCAQMVASWVENGMEEDPRDMALLMSRTLKGEFYY